MRNFKKLTTYHLPLTTSRGFTLMEVLVSIAIFVSTLTMMLVLLDYTLKIHRRTEALRSAAQSARNIVEFMTKEIRNSRIDYGVTDGQLTAVPEPCDGAGSVGVQTYGNYNSPNLTDTKLALINVNGEKECFFWAYDHPTLGLWEAGPTEFNAVDANGDRVARHLALAKPEVVDASGNPRYEKINADNVMIDYLRFYIRPLWDPHTPTTLGSLPRRQPTVTIVARFKVRIGNNEQITIPYQTTISTDDYGIPSN